ncbi:MAG: hypothetical protein QXU54_03755 [Candidatus Micrarchaeia archaeon]
MPHIVEANQRAHKQIPIRILLRDRLGRSESHTVYARYGENLLDVLSRNFEVTLKSGELGTWVTSIRGKGIRISEDACGGLQGYINGTLPYTIVNSSPFFLGFTNIAVTSEFELRMQYDPYLEDIKPPLSFMLLARVSALFDGIGKKSDNALLECASCSAPLNESLRQSIGLVVGSHEIKYYAVAPPEDGNAVNTAIASICCGSLPLPQHRQELGNVPEIAVPAPNAHRIWESIAMHKPNPEDNPFLPEGPKAQCINATEPPVSGYSSASNGRASRDITSAAVPVPEHAKARRLPLIKPQAKESAPRLQMRGDRQKRYETARAPQMDIPAAVKEVACVQLGNQRPKPKRRERRKPATKSIDVFLRGQKTTRTERPKNNAVHQQTKPSATEARVKAKVQNSSATRANAKYVAMSIASAGRAKKTWSPPKTIALQSGRSIARLMFLMDRLRNIRLKSIRAKSLLWNRIRALARRMLKFS